MLVGFVLYTLSNLLFASGDLGEYRSFPSFALISIATITGVVAIVAAIAALRGDRVSGAARTITLGAGAAVIALLAANALFSITYDEPTRAASDITLVAKDISYTPTTLTASAGSVTFFIDNHDAVLHNFHLKNVGTISLPAGHSARKTFNLSAGTYSFVCDFHKDDMKGTLTVS